MSKLLTPLELKIMNILWRLKKAYVKEVIAQWNDLPKPAYNTVSTTIRILEDKRYISHEVKGRTHLYIPAISKLQYQKRLMRNVVENAFQGSFSGLVSALVNSGDISEKELKEIENLIDDAKK